MGRKEKKSKWNEGQIGKEGKNEEESIEKIK